MTDLAERLVVVPARLNDRIAELMDTEGDQSIEPLEAGIEIAQLILCRMLGVNPDDVRWDAASETLDGDTSAQIDSILEVAFGRDDYDIDAIRAMLAAAPPVQQEPVAWQMRFPDRDDKDWYECGKDVFDAVQATGEFVADRAEARPLYAHPLPSEGGWQPIETAPKDGTIIDVWLGNASESDVDFYCTAGTRRSPGWSWKQGKFRPLGGLKVAMPTFEVPTHWMPLPKAPEAS